MYKVGDTLGGCKLLQECGKGSFGSVFLAENLTTNQKYALKILYKQGNHFERELAGLIAYQEKCRHTSLMRIYHVEQDEECIFYTMDAADNLNGKDEYVPDTLGNRLRKWKRLNASELKSILDELLNGLEILHKAGLLHRDIKPDNILWVDGHALLGDIGLVAPGENASMAGTPGFISPEVWNGKRGFEQRDDLYALAMTLYCALSGCNPKDYPEFPLSLTLGGRRDLIRAYNAVLASDSIIQTVTDWRKFESELPHRRTISPRLCWGAGIIAVFMGAGAIFGIWMFRFSEKNVASDNKLHPAQVAKMKNVTDDLIQTLTAEWESACRERIRSARRTVVPVINLSQGADSRKSYAERRREADGEAAGQVGEEQEKINAERERISVLRQLAELLVRHFSDALDDREPKLADALRHQVEAFTRLKIRMDMDFAYGAAMIRREYLDWPKSNSELVMTFERGLSQLPQTEQVLLKRRAVYLALRSSYLSPSYLMSREDAESQLQQWDQMLQDLPQKLK